MLKIAISTDIPKNMSITEVEIRKVLKQSFVCLGIDLTKDIEIEIMLVNKSEIQDLNEKYRKVNSPTDVLSFPQENFKASKINILGSIILCPEVIDEKNEDIIEVLKHGLLHLNSFDHETNSEQWDQSAKKIGCKL